MSKNNSTKNQLKILIVILVGFFTVKTIAPQVFLADTPLFNPDFVARLRNYPAELAAAPGKIIAGLNPFKKDEFADVKLVTPPDNIVFAPIRKGVYAAEDPTTGKKYIKVNAGTKYRIVGTVTINGKQYPKIEFVE